MLAATAAVAAAAAPAAAEAPAATAAAAAPGGPTMRNESEATPQSVPAARKHDTCGI